MKKDTRNIVLTAGVIAVALSTGASAYHEQNKNSSGVFGDDVTTMPSTTPEPVVVQGVSDDSEYRSDDINGKGSDDTWDDDFSPVTIVPTETIKTTTVAPATVTPAKNTVTQVIAPSTNTQTITVAPTTTITKPSRKSKAS